MLRFPDQPEPVGVAVRWRPIARVNTVGPRGSRRYKALFDPGSDDTVFPLAIVPRIGAPLRPDTGERLRWRGQVYPFRFGDVELELTDNVSLWRWPATVGFCIALNLVERSSGKCPWRWPATVGFCIAPIQYVLLGTRGCLQFCDATFRGDDRIVKLEPNRSYPGSIA